MKRNLLLFLGAIALGIWFLPANYWVFFGGLAFLIVAHEFGHWFVARSLGFEVEIFSVGFGQPAVKLGRLWGTNFQITPWLIGGYVSINPTDPKFQASKVWKRAAVMAAGVTMNTLLAVLMAFWMFAGIGDRSYQYDSVTVQQLSAKSTAARDAGVQVGDRLVTIDGRKVNSPDDAVALIRAHRQPTAVDIVVDRNGTELHVPVVKDGQGYVGIVPGGTAHEVYTRLSPGDAAVKSVNMTADGLYRTAQWVGIKIGLVAKPPELPDEAMQVHGIIAIAQMGASAVDAGLFQFLLILWMLNVNLAVINLLPLPVLDGGHLLFLGYEKVRVKPLSTVLQGRLMYVFGLLLFGFMIYAAVNDVIHPIFK